jgi:hypothetical protein
VVLDVHVIGGSGGLFGENVTFVGDAFAADKGFSTYFEGEE